MLPIKQSEMKQSSDARERSMTTKAKATTSRTAQFLSRAIEFSGKTQREIAAEVGLPKPNFLSMLKTGGSPVPLDRIPVSSPLLGGYDEPEILL
jgi:hypothetical protein